MELARAKAIADVIVSEIGKLCVQIEVAGSIRRQRPEVGDIDIVLMTRWRTKILDRVRQSCSIEIAGQQNVRAYLTKANNFQLDLFFASEAGDEWFEPYPCNWGAVLLCRTGSEQHNIQLCERAIAKGMAFNPYKGLMAGNTVVASKTEEEIYTRLGLKWRPPTEREVLSQ